MRTEDFSVLNLVVGILSSAVAGCGGSEPASAGGGGTTSSVESSGGAVASGTGGVAATGGISNVTSSTIGVMGGASSGGTRATDETTGTGGLGTGGSKTNNGGATTKATGGALGTGGASANGGAGTGGKNVTGGSATLLATGGRLGSGGKSSVEATGGRLATGGSSGNATTGGNSNTGQCKSTASKSVNANLSGTGPHKVVMESNTDTQVACGTIYRPQDLGGSEKYPIFVWGEGGCARSGTANQAAMAEIASHGYFVIADGPPTSGGNCPSISMPSTSSDLTAMSKTLLDYVTWAIAESGKSCSAYYESLDTTKVAADGFSCGGLMAESTAGDSRLTAWGITSSGLTSANQAFYKTIHTPVKILLGGSDDVAYENGERDYTNISALGIPIILLSKDGAGHGGDLNRGTGDFNSVNLAWLNWQLKGDTTAAGKAALVGSSCKYCNAAGWEYKSANIQ